jgi:folate-dependent phosphoribosylglycinamide formyltransferase PurN
MPNDTVESLRERVKAVERKIYPLVIEKIASGEIQSKCHH